MFNNLINTVLGTQEKRKTILWASIILVLALLLLVVVNFLFSNETNLSRSLNWADPNKYQAVFLSNGQVYFGRVVDVNSQTLVLTNIYYLRVSQALQAGTGEENSQGSAADSFSLVKLGNEIHGPEDRMSINLEHVLFTEDLKAESKVVEAIRSYEVRK